MIKIDDYWHHANEPPQYEYPVYDLYVFGGSIAEQPDKDDKNARFFSGLGLGRFFGRYDTREEAQQAGRRYVKSYGGGYRSYFRPKYRVVEVTETDYDERGDGVNRYPNY